jgi:NADH dehydrogenase [ubiquinone] 1 alpha subcomplex assembly factor 7
MADALRAAQVVPEFLAAAEIHLVESSRTLRATQERILARDGRRLNWHQDLVEVPFGPTIIIANEFVDALPVRQFVNRSGRWFERQVGLDRTAQLCVIETLTTGEATQFVPKSIRHGAREGAVAEVRPEVQDLLAAHVDRSQDFPLATLIIDYGYSEGSAGDTFQAVRRHRYADPLINPGEADLTALVDFAGLRSAAIRMGLSAWGPIGQGAFLRGLGLNERLQRLVAGANPGQRQDLVTGAERLVGPDQMGELFQVLTLASPGLSVPPPFEEADDKHADLI